jgi:hypothetical protein
MMTNGVRYYAYICGPWAATVHRQIIWCPRRAVMPTVQTRTGATDQTERLCTGSNSGIPQIELALAQKKNLSLDLWPKEMAKQVLFIRKGWRRTAFRAATRGASPYR